MKSIDQTNKQTNKQSLQKYITCQVMQKSRKTRERDWLTVELNTEASIQELDHVCVTVVTWIPHDIVSYRQIHDIILLTSQTTNVLYHSWQRRTYSAKQLYGAAKHQIFHFH